MKQLIASIAIIVALVAFFVVVDRKEFNHHDDVQVVQSEDQKSIRESDSVFIFAAEEVKNNSPVISKDIETKSKESNSTIDAKPIAIPVLSKEEAAKANKEAIKEYKHQRMLHMSENILYIVISVFCIVALVLTIPFRKISQIHFLQIWDFAGWAVFSFVVMYCVILIFQINRPGLEFLTSLQPILTESSLHLFVLSLFLFVLVYIKLILPFFLRCKTYIFFIVELFFAVIIGVFVISHFQIELISDFELFPKWAARWQTLPHDELKTIISPPTIDGVLLRRCYYSYYLLYKIFGCNYIVIEISQLFMHLALGINVYFLAKQCVLREKMARLSTILYFFMPVQYLYLTIPSLDLWGGMLLCLNANLIIYLFKKSFELHIYMRNISVALIPKTTNEPHGISHKIREYYSSFTVFFKRIPWLSPLIASILLGITLFWMEMVRNLQLMLCIPMFLFLSALLVQRILAKRMKLFSPTILFVFVLCLLVPFLSNKAMQTICDATTYGSDGIPVATVLFNSPDEVRQVVRFQDFKLTSSEYRKDFALDAATSYWNLYPDNYSRYFGTKMGYFSDLFNPQFVATDKNIQSYSKEFSVYSLLVWIVKTIFMPLLLVGLLCILFFKHWNCFSFVPVVLFFFFFFTMPTVGECQARYTSIYYAPMCVCASYTLLLCSNGVLLFRKKRMRIRFVNSILWGASSITVLLFAVTSLFSSSSFQEKHQWIIFHENQRQISSGDLPPAYKEYESNYLLSCIFRPAVAGVIPGKTYFEWTIPEKTTVGLEYMLYGYLIAPRYDNADCVIKINGTEVWDSRSFAINGVAYSNSRFNINNESIFFLDNLKFSAEKENILRVEITPKSKDNVDLALSAWGMVPCK